MDFNAVKKKKTVVLVTGCNSGLGFALALALNRLEQYHVIITARGSSYFDLRHKFHETDRFWVRLLDVGNDDNISHLIDDVNRQCGGVDILINNAGISYRSAIEHMDETAELHQLKTNYLGPMALIRAVLPTMREKGFGHIVNVSSVSGMMAMPTMGSYSASKHALDGATEALWYEMKPFGISVSLVQPGFVHSKSFQNVYYSKKAQISGELEGPYADSYADISPFIEKWMAFSKATPEKIAEKLIRLISRRDPPLWVPVTFDAFLFGLLRKYLPRQIFHKVMFAMLPGSKSWGKKYYRHRTLALPATDSSSRQVFGKLHGELTKY